MKINRPIRPKQTTSQELRDDLLRFIQLKFYEGDSVNFAKDQTRLLSWVVLWPAGWLIGKGVTLPGDRYKQILITILMDAIRLGNTSKIQYRPAWLKMVIQSHFRIHGEEIYGEAKNIRNLAEHALLVTGRATVSAGPDPVEDLARAASLLKGKKTVPKAPIKQQLSLL